MFSDVLVVSAHRDTHFSGLDDLRTGMSLRLSTVAETHGEWRVRRAYVVDSRRGRLGFQVAPGDLLLVTCYPLDAFFPGGPLRWVVHATPAPVAEGTLIQGEQLARLD
jgi:sortase A